ncbi:hypothetical protein B7486_79085, partial [cyanobacterium TDX16]
RELDISDPERDGALRNAQLVADLLERPRLGPQLAGSFLLGELASVAQGASPIVDGEGGAP